MQIIKKRLSIHRSGRILRNLWTEYLKMSETCNVLNSVRLRALSSFMENILEADTPLPVVMDELFDELSVIITGLLDVAHRSALQLSESDHDMDPLDKDTLAEAMRKSLLVAELILREKNNRDHMVNVPEIVSRVLKILNVVESAEDKSFSLTIIAHLVQHDECRAEFCRLDGFGAILFILQDETSLKGTQYEKISDQALRIIEECIAADHKLRGAALSGTPLIPSASPDDPSASVGASAEAFVESRPPLSAAHKRVNRDEDTASFSDRSRRNSFGPSAETKQQEAGSSFPLAFATKGLNIAFSVVHEIMSYAPLSSSWLQQRHGEKDGNAGSTHTIGYNNDGPAGGEIVISSASLAEEMARLHTLQKDRQERNTGPLSNREATDRSPSVELDPSCPGEEDPVVPARVDSLTTGPSNCIEVESPYKSTAKGIVSMLLIMMERSRRSPSNGKEATCCLICCTKLSLLRQEGAETLFYQCGGYEVLLNAVVSRYTSAGRTNSPTDSKCRECARVRGSSVQEGKAKRASESPDSREVLAWGQEAKYLTFFLSIIFGRDISLDTVNDYLEQADVQTSQNGVRVHNMAMLAVAVKLIENSHLGVRLLGLQLAEILVRICPLAVPAFAMVGGKSALQVLVVETSLGRNVSDGCTDENRSASSSSSMSSPLFPSMPPQAYGTCGHPVHDLTTKHAQESVKGSSVSLSAESAEGTYMCSDNGGAEMYEVNCMVQEDALDLLVRSTRILTRLAVISSETSTEGLLLLVMIALRLGQNLYGMCKLSRLWHNGRLFTPSIVSTQEEAIPLSFKPSGMCSNCETEPASFECSHQSCINDGLQGLCRECDRVFHKSVTKKGHIRLPVLAHGSGADDTLQSLEENIRTHFTEENVELLHFPGNPELESTLQARMCQWKVSAYTKYVANVLCLVLHHIRMLTDDRRARQQSVISSVYKATMVLLRLFLTSFDTVLNADPLKRFCLFSSVPVLEDVVSREIFGAACGSPVAMDCIDSGEEPPEDTQVKPRRLCLAYSLHIVSRLFVTCAGTQSVAQQTGPPSTPADALRFFREVGGECCLALMATEGWRYSLTTGDKQFAVWTLREAVVSTYQVDPVVAVSLLRWVVWLLGCPAADSAAASNISGGARTKYGSVENILLDRETLRQGELDGMTYATPPSAQPTIPYCIRIFIIQELRALLSGDDWESILPGNEIQNKSLCLGRGGHISKSSKRSDFVSFRIPLSKRKIQLHLVQLAAIDTLLSIICGDLSNPLVRQGLVPNSAQSPLIYDDILAEEWWSALATLASVVVSNDEAKEAMDACFGIVPFTRLILPCIEYLAMRDEFISSALIDFVIELSIRGARWLAPSAPFVSWSKLPPTGRHYGLSRDAKNAEVPSFVEQLTRRAISQGRQSRSDIEMNSSICDISPVCLMKTDTVKEIMACLYPCALYRYSIGDTCTPPGKNTRTSSGSILANGVGGFDRQRHDSAEPFLEYCDDASTGRGSFSVHSMRGFPHTQSFSTFHTPTPSVVGGDRVPDDVSISMSKHGKTRTDDINPDYCGEYFPFLAGLNWSLSHMNLVLLGVCYEFLLQQKENGIQSDIKPSTGMEEFEDIVHRDSDPLLTSLREQSVQQHLQTLLCSSLHDAHGRLLHWEPQYSKLQFRDMASVELLFGLAVITVGDQQTLLLKALSHIIDGNPSNLSLLSRSKFVMRMASLLFDNDGIPRGRFCQIISQILRQNIVADELKVFVERARSVSGMDVKDAIVSCPFLPAGGFRKCIVQSDSTDLDDAGCQILYMLGVAAEEPEPAMYFHFDQGDPFTSGIQLPPVDRCPPPSAGFSIIAWIRTGGMGNVPISVLMQTTVQSLDQSSGGDLFSMILFFRVVYRVGPARDCDNVSVASGGVHDSPGTDETLKKRVLQLCVCYHRHHEMQEGSELEAVESIVGLNGGIISSFVGFSTPDVLVDYDFSEMGSWHLLCLSSSSSGIYCLVDGIVVPVLYWTALGYANLQINRETDDTKEFQLPPNIKYPVAQREQYICGCVGAMFYDHGYFLRSIETLTSKRNDDSCSERAKGKIIRELEFLQCYSETIKGFSGAIAVLHIVEGTVEAEHMLPVFQSGVIGGIPPLPSHRKLLVLTTAEAVYRDSEAGSRGAPHRDGDDVSYDEDLLSRGRISNRRSCELSLTPRDASGASYRRISRSLSPISVSRAIDGATISRDELSLSRSRIDILPLASHSDIRAGVAQQQQHSTSLVADLLTMFSGPVKEDDKYSPIHTPIIHGSTTIYRSKAVSAEMEQLGGMALWYPLLVIDRPRQVATLRIIASIIATSQTAQEEFHTLGIANVILYCLHCTPDVTSQSSIQVFFDLTCSPRGTQARCIQSSKIPERIRRIEFLVLAVHVAVASPKRMQLAKSTMEWLIELCDESVDNINKILKHFDLTPFFIIMSLWATCQHMQSIERLTFPLHDGIAELAVPLKPFAHLGKEETKRESTCSDPATNKEEGSVALPYRLQVSVSRFIKLIMTGSLGELPAVPIPIGVTTPTGFSILHMTALLNFIQYSARFDALAVEDILPRNDTQSPSQDTSSATIDDFIIRDSHVFVSQSKRLTKAAAMRLHASQLALDSILDACDGPLAGTILNMIRSALPGNGLWYLIFDLLGCSHVAIKARAVHLLGYSLSAADGEMDARVVMQFDRIQGFGCVAAKLPCNLFGDSEIIIDELMSLFFWRRGKKGARCGLSGMDTDGSVAPSIFNKIAVVDESPPCAVAAERSTAMSESVAYSPSKDATTHDAEGDGHFVQERLTVENDDGCGHAAIRTPCVASKNGLLDKTKLVKHDVITLPQVLKPILALIQHENSLERVQRTFSSIEASLCPDITYSDGSDGLRADASARAVRNMEALCGQRDWLLWICECLLFFQRRSSQNDLGDASCFSMSEAESLSGVDSGDESVDGSHTYDAHRAARYLSPIKSAHHNALEKFVDPLLNLVKTAVAIDIAGKPQSSRKFYDIFRLTDMLGKPESRNILYSILFDVLDAFEAQPLQTSTERALNVLRNLSAFLDHVLEKCETTMEFCVKSVHVINSMTYRAPPDLRSKIKDTMLPEVRNAYLTRCLVDRTEDIWTRVSSLAELHSSVLNLIVSGTPTRTLNDQHVLLLFVDLFLEAIACYAEFVVSSDESMPSDAIDEALNLEMAALVLIQNCTQSSVACRRIAEKLLSTEFDEQHRSILLDAFCNSFGHNIDSPVCMSPADDKSSGATAPSGQRSGWWGYWYVDSSLDASKGHIRRGSAGSAEASSEAGEDEHALPADDVERGDEELQKIMSEKALWEEMADTPTTSADFLEWINRGEQREYVDVLRRKLAKVIPSVYQKTDKIQEKIIQRRSRHLRQLQEKGQKDRFLENKSVQELLAKAHSSNEKIGKKCEKDMGKWANALMEKIMKGAEDFGRNLEVSTLRDYDSRSGQDKASAPVQVSSVRFQDVHDLSAVSRMDWVLDSLAAT